MTKEPPNLDDDQKPLQLVSYGITHVGLERRNNEDAFFADEAAGFFTVCDGMGGHASGEIASRIAVETMVRFVTETVHEPGFRFPFSTPEATTHETRVLDSAVRLANRSVFAEAQKDATHKGMGTTLVAVLRGEHTVGVVHVGDSRVYRWRTGQLEQITEDHSLLNHYRRTRPMTDDEIRNFKGKNVIVRAVGLRDSVQPEVTEVEALRGDILVLCSDGLSDLVDDETICEIINECKGDISAATEDLIDAALAAGGKDNVTVLLAQVVEGGVTSLRQAPTDKEDTSPGFEIGPNGELWDQETMPSYEIPALPGQEANVVVAPELVDAPTPRELPAITPKDIARVVVQREHDTRLRESGPTPAPRDASFASPPPIPGLSRNLDVNAPTPPARLAVSASQAEQGRRQTGELGRVTAQTRKVPSRAVTTNGSEWEDRTDPGGTLDSSGQPIPLPPGASAQPAAVKVIPLPPNVLAAQAAAAAALAAEKAEASAAPASAAGAPLAVVVGDDFEETSHDGETPAAGMPSLAHALVLATTRSTATPAPAPAHAPAHAPADDEIDADVPPLPNADDPAQPPQERRVDGEATWQGDDWESDVLEAEALEADAFDAEGPVDDMSFDAELSGAEPTNAAPDDGEPDDGTLDDENLDDDPWAADTDDGTPRFAEQAAKVPSAAGALAGPQSVRPAVPPTTSEPVGTRPLSRPALDPALEAVMRRSSERRSAIPRGTRPVQDVETPFARKPSTRPLPGAPAGDLAAGGRHDPGATVGPGVMPESGRPLTTTSRYDRSELLASSPPMSTANRNAADWGAAARGAADRGAADRGAADRGAADRGADQEPNAANNPNADQPDGSDESAAVWDLPTLRMEAISAEHVRAHAQASAASGPNGPAAPALDTEPEVP